MSKADKYKEMVKEQKKEIKALNNDLNNMMAQREEDGHYYEEAMQAIESRDKKLARDHMSIVKALIGHLSVI